jgi:hypothetical protein
LEGEEAALVSLEMGEGGASWLPLVGEGGLEEVALVFALGSIRFLEEEWEVWFPYYEVCDHSS